MGRAPLSGRKGSLTDIVMKTETWLELSAWTAADMDRRKRLHQQKSFTK